MIDWPLLSVIIFLPLVGGLIILFIKEDEVTSNNIKWSALLTSIGTFILSLILWLQFDYLNPSLYRGLVDEVGKILITRRLEKPHKSSFHSKGN